MAFRKRNIPLSRAIPPPSSSDPSSLSTSATATTPLHPSPVIVQLPPGTRPSPITGRPTTSTGLPTLDALFAGHAGLPLGTSVLLEESGTTDYAGAILRVFAAEGVVQGHGVSVVGAGEGWGRGLPGLVEDGDGGGSGKAKEGKEGEKMKIAWRYEGLGVAGGARGTQNANRIPSSQGDGVEEPAVFCHSFDLAKRLAMPVGAAVNYIPIPRTSSPAQSPFQPILQNIQQKLDSTPPNTIHRLVVPSLLSPTLYPPSASHPNHILAFLHTLRALLRAHPTRLTALVTFPLSLYPRSSAVVRWTELLADGVFELSPFPYSHSQAIAAAAGTAKDEENPQGMFTIHKLPVYHERGGGAGGEDVGEDMAFTLSRRRFVVQKYSLPPVEGDQEAQEAALREASGVEGEKMPRKVELEF